MNGKQARKRRILAEVATEGQTPEHTKQKYKQAKKMWNNSVDFALSKMQK